VFCKRGELIAFGSGEIIAWGKKKPPSIGTAPEWKRKKREE